MHTGSTSALMPRERIIRALSFEQPDRVPFSWGFGPTAEMGTALASHLSGVGIDWDRLRRAADDVVYLLPPYTGPALSAETDIWGIQRASVSYGNGAYEEITRYPLAEADTAADMAAYPWPNPAAYDDVALASAFRACDPKHRCAWKIFAGNPFETYCWMTGLETALINLLTEPEVVMIALDHIVRFFGERLQRQLASCGTDVDLIFFADDLGGQQGLLISREAYRAVLQPYHRRLMQLAHEKAPQAKVMFHSDGAVFDIVPDLLDAGVDILEAVQIDAAGMDPVRLKEAYGNRLAFHGAISVQSLLPHADAGTVYQECRRLVDILGHNGGYIAAPSHAIQMGTSPENVLAMLRAVLGDEDYVAALDASQV